MTIPSGLFSIMLWGALAIVAAAAIYLLAVMVREWRSGSLW